jgi:hypothetical protein
LYNWKLNGVSRALGGAVPPIEVLRPVAAPAKLDRIPVPAPAPDVFKDVGMEA